jgi:hypothetical protein
MQVPADVTSISTSASKTVSNKKKALYCRFNRNEQSGCLDGDDTIHCNEMEVRTPRSAASRDTFDMCADQIPSFDKSIGSMQSSMSTMGLSVSTF